MQTTATTRGLSELRSELNLLESETFEIQDFEQSSEALASTTSCTSTTGSSTSTSGTSCCG